ncbi:MAG TPA: type I-U CRISPR-associated protein Csb2, partial [Candidatus Binataceae bacterium]|nr:type I-U CRISPR-associated protein Csb2 [Candidatus Binataceae bacterium]
STFHGRHDRNQPEWPPSPMRLFQALVATAVRQDRGELSDFHRYLFFWLEQHAAPSIIGPSGHTSSGYSLSVPNNAMDVVAKAWSRGNYSNKDDANPATHRSMKRFRPMLLEGDALHYLWTLPDPLTEQLRANIEILTEVARGISAFGWGIDVAVGNAKVLTEQQADALGGEKWIPDNIAGEDLRLPREGTLDHLIRRHRQFVDRLTRDGLNSPAPVSIYTVAKYRRAFSHAQRPFTAFALLKPDSSGFRPFDTTRQSPRLAEMVRGAAARAAERVKWPPDKISRAIMGHGEPPHSFIHTPVASARFAWLPLPTIEYRGDGKPRVIGDIRRILVTSFNDDFDDEITWARDILPGEEIFASADAPPLALLSRLPLSDRMINEYLRPSDHWATVTPVVLPGYDDPDHYRARLKKSDLNSDEQKRLLGQIADRIDRLLRKAIMHCGFSQEMADYAQLEWREASFWPGADLAGHYTIPDHLGRFPRLHVKISWRDRDNHPILIPGPICLGGGRFYGLGLFAATYY